MDKTTEYGVVFVTASSVEEAEAIANSVVEAKLAACVSMSSMHSIYAWKGDVYKEQEWQLIIKTNLSQFTLLEAKIREIHSYEVPEIIAIPIVAGSQPYLEWISRQVK